MGKVIVNERCFVRNQECGRIFSGSKLCFIACPASEEVSLELSVIKDKLRSFNIEPYIAVEERELGKDIFCEKICGKIIESKFCIAVLNHVKGDDDHYSPNANVYYEYGMMTSMNKKIIPIQKEGQKLAFNIQSFESIMYKPATLSKEIEEAIRKTIATTDQDEAAPSQGMSPAWIAGLRGYIELDRLHDREFRDIIQQCKDTHMKAFLEPLENEIAIIGPFSILSPQTISIEFQVIFNRVQQLYKKMKLQLEGLESKMQEESEGLGRLLPRERVINEIQSLGQQTKILENIKLVLIDNPEINSEEVIQILRHAIPIEIWSI